MPTVLRTEVDERLDEVTLELGLQEGVEGVSSTVGIPEREGAVGRTLALMHLAVCSEVAPINVAVERGADLRTIECRVEGRLQAVRGV